MARPRSVVPWQERFWANVQKGEPGACWLWTGPRPKKYGYLSINNKTEGSHRASWLVHHGAIPAGMHVLHNCPTGDNPACVNPAHLYLGTHDDNMRDRDRKGRTRKGETQPLARLTESDVLDIRRRRAAGEECAPIAAEYGIDVTTVSNVANGSRWGHVEGAIEKPLHARGEKHHAARLTPDLVRQIRRRAAAGENMSAVARELGVSNGAVDHVVARRSWKHVPDEETA